MKSPFASLFFLFLSGNLCSQITVTNATFPAAGDTLRMAVDYSPGTIGSLTPPGFQDWDFTGLSADSTYHIVYRPVNEGSVGASLPDAELFAELSPGAEHYYNVTDTRFELMAYNGILPYDLVANNTFNYIPPLPERFAPLNFFDIHASATGFLETFVPSDFSPLLMLQLTIQTNNVKIDSMRYRLAINSFEAVDAFGSMSIPGGIYEVLRVKRTRYTETRIDAKIPPLGWLDITDQAIMAGFFGLGVDTTYTYLFFNDVSKEPIAVVTLDSNQAYATHIVFKNTAPVVQVTDIDQGGYASVVIVPNPVTDIGFFAFRDILVGRYRCVLYDSRGQMVFQQSIQNEDGYPRQYDLPHLHHGIYFLRLYDEHNRKVCQEKFVKM